MDFDVFAFELEKFTPKNLITPGTLNSLCEEIEEIEPALLNACGCYVFALRASKGYKPWYVGQANKSRLVNESLNPSNRGKYNEVLAHNFGTPIMFLLPQVTRSGDWFTKPTVTVSGRASINFLEEWLIASALQKNPNLLNEKKTAFLRKLHVTGIFNPKKGESHVYSRALKKALF